MNTLATPTPVIERGHLRPIGYELRSLAWPPESSVHSTILRSLALIYDALPAKDQALWRLMAIYPDGVERVLDIRTVRADLGGTARVVVIRPSATDGAR